MAERYPLQMVRHCEFASSGSSATRWPNTSCVSSWLRRLKPSQTVKAGIGKIVVTSGTRASDSGGRRPTPPLLAETQGIDQHHCAIAPSMRVLYGANRPGAKVSQGVLDEFWLQGMLASIKGVYDCIKAFSETDFTADLKKFDVPTLLIHGDDDQIVPIADSTLLSAKIIKGAMLKVYKGAPHGL